jgi:hypothetical protein
MRGRLSALLTHGGLVIKATLSNARPLKHFSNIDFSFKELNAGFNLLQG